MTDEIDDDTLAHGFLRVWCQRSILPWVIGR